MSQAEPIDVEPEEKPVEARAEAEVDVKAIPVRDDLPAGHWLRGQRAARVVWSGELDKVVDKAGKALVPVATKAELVVALDLPAEKSITVEPVEEKPAEEPIDLEEVTRVR